MGIQWLGHTTRISVVAPIRLVFDWKPTRNRPRRRLRKRRIGVVEKRFGRTENAELQGNCAGSEIVSRFPAGFLR